MSRTCFEQQTAGDDSRQAGSAEVGRDPAARRLYLGEALAAIPRLLGAIDRNPFRPTYGCLDRQYWHYRTSAFPSEMYQEGVLALALVHAAKLPGNRWCGNQRVRELAVAGIRFAARSCHADGSCDDYYPFERALGAAVFSLQAAARAYQILDPDDPEILAWLKRRARWIVRHDESGRLTNHHALAALGLLRVGQITGEAEFREAADARIDRVLRWQHEEGWFDEYGGADPGYQTLTIDCLAKYRQITRQGRLDEPLRRAVGLARWFLHPDGSYGGEYGSRGTYHFYAHGFELLARTNAEAADLADGFLRAVAAGKQADVSDARMSAHRPADLIEAYLDWSPVRPRPAAPQCEQGRYFPGAGLWVQRGPGRHTVISAARGGVFKHFAEDQPPVTDAGLIVELADGRIAVSQMHDPGRNITPQGIGSEGQRASAACFSVSGPLHWVRFETVGPWKQALLHLGMVTIGRWCRGLVRRVLQRRLITSRAATPIRLTRHFDLGPDHDNAATLRVTDSIELLDPRLRVRRMSFATDLQAAYVAAANVYQESVLAQWHDLAEWVQPLNAQRRVTIVRLFGRSGGPA